ncbi:MAG: bifunctional adenosylcobinamide kinase/adenosylcobinamide-phosphate guanylyltransferase [Gloeomargarita sp. GMQP_bins_120]
MARNPQLTLVTGPTRSGKSRWAEHLAAQSGLPVLYVATAWPDPTDPEWQARLQAHRQRRPSHWQTREPPLDLPALCAHPPAHTCLLVDSLGTWVAQLLEHPDPQWQQQQQTLVAALARLPNPTILVAEEVGWGVVPASAAGRLFRDRLGELVQTIGAIAGQVYLVTGGWVVNLAQLGQPLPNDSGSPDFASPA